MSGQGIYGICTLLLGCLKLFNKKLIMEKAKIVLYQKSNFCYTGKRYYRSVDGLFAKIAISSSGLWNPRNGD